MPNHYRVKTHPVLIVFHVLSSSFDKAIIVHISATVNKIMFILTTFVYLNRKMVHILDTLTKIMFLLKQQHKTQKELMIFLGLGKTAFTGWKNGANTSYLKHIGKIAEFFNVSTDYLLGKENSPLSKESGLSAEQREIISLFDSAPPELQAAALAVLKSAEVSRKLPDDAQAKK